MPVEIKKYILADKVIKLDSARECFDFMASEKEIVKSPDFSNATDLEKLEWVLNDIGMERKLRSAMSQQVYMSGKIIFCLGFKFESNGKLIK